MTVTVSLSVLDLEAIVRDVWAALQFDGVAATGAPAVDAGQVTATVSVTGGWDGHVAVQADHPTAAALAAAMLGVDARSVEQADLVDAMGELVNIVGGNVKALLDPPNQLSLPHVVIGAVDGPYWPGAVEVCQFETTASGGRVGVSVWTRSGSVNAR